MSLQFLSGHDNIQEIRTDPLDYHRLSVIHSYRVFQSIPGLYYQLSGSKLPNVAINFKSNSECGLFAQTVFAQAEGKEHKSKQNYEGFNRLYIQRNRFETQGCQKGHLMYNGFSFALKFLRPYIYKSQKIMRLHHSFSQEETDGHGCSGVGLVSKI